MATDREVARAFNAGLFEADTLESPNGNNGHFNSGQFDAVQLGADEEGVVATIQVGSDSPIENAEAVVTGQFLGTNPSVPRESEGDSFLAGNTQVARPEIGLRDNGGADESSGGVQVALKGSSRPTATSDPYNMRPRLEARTDTDPNGANLDASDVDPLRPTESIRGGTLRTIGDGDHLNIVVLNGESAETYSLSNSIISIPILKWTGRGL
jgi:hypothetical protein